MSTTTKKPKSKRRRICFVPGCREAITDPEESFCPKCIAKIERAGKRAKSA